MHPHPEKNTITIHEQSNIMSSIPSDGSFFEQFQRLAAEKAAVEKAAEEEREKEERRLERDASEQASGTADMPPLPPPDAPQPSDPDCDFMPATSFSGPKPGFIFKRGDQGLGEMPARAK